MNQDNQIEAEIQAKGKTAARVTPADVEAAIASEFYFSPMDALRLGWLTFDHEDIDTRFKVADIAASIPTQSYSSTCLNIDANTGIQPGIGLITICVLITTNGTKLVGVNEGPVSPENFDAEMGRNMARQKAIDQLWPMLGYELRTKLQR